MSLHVCSRVRVSQPPYSGGHHLNLILLATLGTYHGDNRSLALSTKRLRTFLSRYTKSPLHGEVCQHACAPVKSSSRIKVDIHLQKTIPLIPCMTGFFWFFSPHRRACLIVKPGKLCGSFPAVEAHSPWGLLSCPSSSTPCPRILGSLKGFFRPFSVQLQNKEASWCINFLAQIQPAAPS